ncbi:MAG: ComEC/Rec2 family competence protein, partial [Simkaniaceae bacterium]|nr:ComEC/Rec2 family competence protein [Simkaniaceae bacterium]
ILLKALDVAIGVAFGLSGHLLFPFLALIFSRNKVVFTLAALFAFFISPPPSSLDGEATIKITSIERVNYPFRPRMKYRGTIEKIGDKRVSLPCVFSLPLKRARKLKSDRLTFKNAQCEKIGTALYAIRPGNIPSHRGTFSIAQKRYEIKQNVAAWLKKHYPSRRTHALMTTFATGTTTDPLLAYEFSQLGLQHILSISGLHFGVIALVLAKILSLFTKKRVRHLFLLILLTGYVIFLGSSPSVSRTYIALLYYLLGTYLGKRATAENALGIALIFALLISPRAIFDIGLQLSFAATYGIITLYPKIRAYFPKNPPFYKRPAYASVSLSLAVNALVLPILLYHFHTIPLLSFTANLFMPPLLMISLVLLMLGLHPLNELYTSIILLPITFHPDLPSINTPPFHFAYTLIPLLLTLDVIPIFRENMKSVLWRE